MRRCGTVPNKEDAQNLADYLLAQGIETRVEENGDEWAIWVLDEDRLDTARQELEQYLENPGDQRYAQAIREAKARRKEKAAKEKEFRKNYVDVRRTWDSWAKRSRTLTMILIGVSVLVTLLTWRNESLRFYFFIAQPGLTPWESLLAGQVWRPVAPIFLHFTILHILFNMYMLYHLGSAIERNRGTIKYALMVLFVGVVSNLGQWYWSMIFDGRPSPYFGGMSGVVYGLFGYIWMKHRFEPGSGFYMDQGMIILLVGWLILCMTRFAPVGNVANGAHLVGMLSGMALGYGPTGWRRLKRSLG